MRRCRWLLIPCSFVVLAATSPVWAQDAEVDGAAMLVSVGAVGDGAETIGRIVLASMEIYLEQQGIIAIRTDQRPDGVELTRSLAREARSAGADFVLHGDVLLAGNDVEIELLLFLVETGEVLSSARTTEVVGLTLDRAVTGLTATVTEQARPYITAAADRRRAARSPARDPISVADEPGTADRFIAIDAGFAPFFPVDSAAAYLGVGYGVSVSLLVLPGRDDVLGVGFAARGILAEAAGAATTASLRLIPLSLVLQFSGIPDPFAPHFRLGGGVALITAENDSLGTFTSVVPYAATELGISLRLFGPFKLATFVGFETVFESSLWIFGFTPGIGLTVAF